MRKTWLAIPAAAACAAGALAAAAAADSTGAAGTIYACVSSTQHLVNVNTAGPEACPSGAYPVSWQGTVPGPSPSPSPTATSPGPSPSPTGPAAACVTSDPQGSCGPYSDPQIYGSSGYNTYVLNNIWNPVPGAIQALTAYDPGTWSVTASMPAGNTAVVSYPDTQQIFTRTDNTPAPLSSFTSVTSTFAETMNATGQTSAEAAWDIWAGQPGANYADEIMIWNDQVNRGTCGGATPLTSATFGGTGGVPVQDWNLCRWGTSELIWYLAGGNEQSGAVDILAMLDWLVGSGYLPAGTGLNQVDYGFEICSTGGVPETFTVSQYGITAAAA